MKLFRRTLCKLGHHPHVRFVGDVPGYLQCQDCRRIQKFGIPKRWDDPYPWVEEDEWQPDEEWAKRHRG